MQHPLEPGAPKSALLPFPKAQAELGGISRSLCKQIVATGAIASVKIGHRRLIVRSSLEAYVAKLAAENAK